MPTRTPSSPVASSRGSASAASSTPLDVGGARRGILSAMSAIPDRFSERDLGFLAAVATWVGMLTHRRAGGAARGRLGATRGSPRRRGAHQADPPTAGGGVLPGRRTDQRTDRAAPGAHPRHGSEPRRGHPPPTRPEQSVAGRGLAVERGLYSSAWRDDSDGTDGVGISDGNGETKRPGGESDPDDTADALRRESRRMTRATTPEVRVPLAMLAVKMSASQRINGMQGDPSAELTGHICPNCGGALSKRNATNGTQMAMPRYRAARSRLHPAQLWNETCVHAQPGAGRGGPRSSRDGGPGPCVRGRSTSRRR